MIPVAANTDPLVYQGTPASLWVRRLFAPGATVTMAAVEYTPTQDCVTRLRAAEDAYQRLIMGEAVQVVSHGGRTVTYVPGQAAALQVYIRQLRSQCDSITGGSRRSVGRARSMWWRR